MPNSKKILKIYKKSFIANVYGTEPFRMIGLIDVGIMYEYGEEKVTLAYFRSSGTNSGKVKGLWYPILGIKLYDGKFVEFSEYINYVLRKSTRHGRANEGWLAKSVFFENTDNMKMRGFSCGIHYKALLWIGCKLRELYEAGEYKEDRELIPETLNKELTTKSVYNGNKKSQRENFEKFVEDIYKKR